MKTIIARIKLIAIYGVVILLLFIGVGRWYNFEKEIELSPIMGGFYLSHIALFSAICYGLYDQLKKKPINKTLPIVTALLFYFIYLFGVLLGDKLGIISIATLFETGIKRVLMHTGFFFVLFYVIWWEIELLKRRRNKTFPR